MNLKSKNKFKYFLCLFLAFTIPLTACTTTNKANNIITLKETFMGNSIDIAPTAYSEYLSCKSKEEKALYLYNYIYKKYKIEDKKISFSWETENDDNLKTYLYISSDKTFTKVDFKIDVTGKDYYEIGGFIPNTYYWKIVDSNGVSSSVDSFIVSNTVRAITCGKIVNMRDLGGWKTEDGKSIKYGMLYRSAELHYEDSEDIFNLGIKSEIDLREDSNGISYAETALQKSLNINYLQAPIRQSDYILKNKEYYFDLTQEQLDAKRHKADFNEIFAESIKKIIGMMSKEENYPIIFHCTSGADRTGTLAFIIEGLLGVEIENLYSDFELTSFNMGGNRWRSGIDLVDGVPRFNNEGFVRIPDNYVAMGLLYKGLIQGYSTGDGKLSSAIINYLKTDCGVTDNEINSLKSILLK